MNHCSDIIREGTKRIVHPNGQEQRGMGSIGIIEKRLLGLLDTEAALRTSRTIKPTYLQKEGTSLSKVYGLINRFSEDIDLVLDWNKVHEGENPMADRSKRQQGKINETLNDRAITYIAKTMMPWLQEALGSHCELEINNEEKDQGHVVRVKYPKTENASGILPYIQLEIGPLASWLPHSEHIITPYAAEDFPQLFSAPECRVRAIDAERTFGKSHHSPS